MASYRVYFIDDHGHIRSARERECETDAEALAFAEQVAEGQSVEIWNRARLVGRIEARRRSA